MKNLSFTFLLALILFACKSDSLDESVETFNKAVKCPEDSILLKQIFSENLLFDNTYVLIDTIYQLLEFRFDTTHLHQKQTIEKLIRIDSIPNLTYSICEKRKELYWNDYKSTKTISTQTLNKLFKDPYIISGKIDNYKELSQLTGKDGFMYITDFYYTPSFQYVLVAVEFHCGWKCGQAQIRLYIRKKNQWLLEMKYVTIQY